MATRKELVARLREAGDAEGARVLASARRPTTAAWALNRLVRERRPVVEDLLARGHELREVQTGGRRIDADELRTASTRRREAVSTAAEAAIEVAASALPGIGSHRDAITTTLDAASIDEALGEQLLAGRLEREVAGPVGFPATAAPSAPASTRARKRTRPSAEPARDTSPKKTPSEPDVDAVAEAEAATTRARDARARADELASVAEEQERAVERTAAELEAARTALREAQTAARRAAAEARDLERRAERMRRASTR